MKHLDLRNLGLNLKSMQNMITLNLRLIVYALQLEMFIIKREKCTTGTNQYTIKKSFKNRN